MLARILLGVYPSKNILSQTTLLRTRILLKEKADDNSVVVVSNISYIAEMRNI